MYVRCSSCKTSTRVPLVSTGTRVTCTSCGRIHDLGGAPELGKTPEERYHKAQAFAEENRIDLASAYSVLLDLMSVEEARVYGDASLEPADGKTPGPDARPGSDRPAGPASPPRPTTYDPGFRDAIAGGYLTIRMAVERGDRVAHASRLAQRHGIPLKLAFEVTDNKVRLRQAIERTTASKRSAVRSSPAPSEDFSGGGRKLFAYAAVLLAIGGAYLLGGSNAGGGGASPSGTGPADRRASASRAAAPSVQSVTAIRSNASGRLTQLVGPTPDWVLRAFCASGLESRKRVPVRVEESTNGSLGIFRESGQLLAITILRDSNTESWIAGNGANPIAFSPVRR